MMLHRSIIFIAKSTQVVGDIPAYDISARLLNFRKPSGIDDGSSLANLNWRTVAFVAVKDYGD